MSGTKHDTTPEATSRATTAAGLRAGERFFLGRVIDVEPVGATEVAVTYRSAYGRTLTRRYDASFPLVALSR